MRRLPAASRACLFASAIVAVALIAGLFTRQQPLWQGAAIALAALLPLTLRTIPALRPYQYTAWIVAAVVVAMLYPAPFASLSPDRKDAPQNKWIMLAVIQLVMFGMATQMSLREFAGLGRMWYGVAVGTVLQFTIMPLLGYALAVAFGFSPEIAAGIVLIGSCSSGLASNVMTYIANANLPLSIALSAVGTLISPFVTPLWMKWLAGRMVPVDYFGMMMQIVKIMVVPIGAALLHDYLKSAPRLARTIANIAAVAGAAWLAALAAWGWDHVAVRVPSAFHTPLGIVGFFAEAVVAGVLFHALWRAVPGVANRMPLFSMFGIIFFTTITTATGRQELLSIGWLLMLVVVVHNAAGFVLGYTMSRLCGLDEKSARTVTLEVGLQNGGMASGLASAMGKLGTVGLAAAVFSPWMNVSGSILANYWRKRPLEASAADSFGCDANEPHE